MLSNVPGVAEVATSDKIVVEKAHFLFAQQTIQTILEQSPHGAQFESIQSRVFAEGTAIEDLFKSDRVLIGVVEHLKVNKPFSAS